MIKQIYSIRDLKASAYLQPFFNDSPILAERHVQMLMTHNEMSPLNQFPKDFDLYEIGEWDDITGTIQMHPDKKFVQAISNINDRVIGQKEYQRMVEAAMRSEIDLAYQTRPTKGE